MAQKLDFTSLLNRKVADVKPPVLVPTGHYTAIIVGPMTRHDAVRTGNVAMRFPIRLTAPGEDVDSSELAEAGGLPDKTYNMDFWMSEDAQYRFVDFCESCGVYDESLSLGEQAEALIEASPEFTIQAKHETDAEDPDKKYLRLDNPVGNA